MTDNPAKDAERLAEANAEIERLRELFQLDGKQYSNHVRGLTKTHEARITKYMEAVRDRDATIARLTQERDELQARCAINNSALANTRQERDEARRSAEALQTEVARLRELFDATRRWNTTQPSADDVERAREMLFSPPGYRNCVSDVIVQKVAAALTAARREGFKKAISKTTPGWRDLNMALQMIRDAVEELGPVGSVPSRDVGPPNYAQDAEDIIAGITSLIGAARREGAELRALDEAVSRSVANAARLVRFLKEREADVGSLELPWQAAADMLAGIDATHLDAIAARDAAVRAPELENRPADSPKADDGAIYETAPKYN